MAAISYPVPMDNWETFKPDVEQFTTTWRAHPPGWDNYLLFAMVCNDTVSRHFESMMTGIDRVYRHYDGGGCDIGCHLHAADSCGDNFLIGLSTRVYFHRAGWINHLMQAREQFGPGLYATALSRETGRLHCRTHCFGMDAALLREYPFRINSRTRGYFFESGNDGNPEGSFLNWCQKQGYTCKVVYWDGVHDIVDGMKPDNIFRKGDQSNLLVFDRHTKLWADADVEERMRLTDMTYA